MVGLVSVPRAGSFAAGCQECCSIIRHPTTHRLTGIIVAGSVLTPVNLKRQISTLIGSLEMNETKPTVRNEVPLTDKRTVLMEVTLESGASQRLRDLTKEGWDALREKIPSHRLPNFEARGSWFNLPPFVADMEEAEAWISAGFQIVVSRIRGMNYAVHPRELIREALNGGNIAKKNVVNITVHGAALYAVSNVKLMEDCCTDQLQHELDIGWRIVAVCPPNDARRPTYILGHHDPHQK